MEEKTIREIAIQAAVTKISESILGQVERKVVDAVTEKAANAQRAESEALARTQEARQLLSTYESRLVQVKTELTNVTQQRDAMRAEVAELLAEKDRLATERESEQSAIDELRREYDGLVPAAARLRREVESKKASAKAKR